MHYLLMNADGLYRCGLDWGPLDAATHYTQRERIELYTPVGARWIEVRT
jgi:hypothetical protein